MWLRGSTVDVRRLSELTRDVVGDWMASEASDAERWVAAVETVFSYLSVLWKFEGSVPSFAKLHSWTVFDHAVVI